VTLYKKAFSFTSCVLKAAINSNLTSKKQWFLWILYFMTYASHRKTKNVFGAKEIMDIFNLATDALEKLI